MERNKPLGWETNNFRLMYESGWIVVVDGWAWHFTECKQASKPLYLYMLCALAEHL